MKIISVICFIIFVVQGMCFAAGKADIKDEADRINYSIGYQIGGDFQQQKWEVRPEILIRGIKDAVGKNNPLLSSKEMNATLVNMKKKLVADQREMDKQTDEKFLAENARKEGVVVLPSGAQYKVLKEGTGKQPSLSDNVSIRYKVRRATEKEPATGYAITEPKTYPLKKALPGLQEVLQLMKEGAVYQIVLPPGSAAGKRAEAIENMPVLVYELELLKVNPSK